MKKSINGKRKKNKNVLIFIVLFLFVCYICTFLFVFNRNYTFIESAFKNVASKVNEFFINKAYSINNYSNNFINAKIKYLQTENNNLRKALDLETTNESYLIAEVVNHSSKTWFNKISINKGYDNGVEKDFAVVNELGLIGFVSKVSKNQSEVKLITSVNEDDVLSVLIQTQSEDVYGIITSYDSKKGLFKVEDITSKVSIKTGDNVVLTGFDNEMYKGIYVGYVVKEETTSYGLTKTVWIKPGVDFNDLMFVGIVTVEE